MCRRLFLRVALKLASKNSGDLNTGVCTTYWILNEFQALYEIARRLLAFHGSGEESSIKHPLPLDSQIQIFPPNAAAPSGEEF
jgi:hypothetical protein